jgi:hypothetical protein
MSAGKLAGQVSNREHTPARFITLNGENGPIVLNVNYILICQPPQNYHETVDGKYPTNISIVNGQIISVREDTKVIAQILSADGLHGTSR